VQIDPMKRLTLTPALLLWLGLIAITAALLYAFGRSLICPCGTLKFIDTVRGPGEDSQHFLDIYSLSHVLHGLLFYFAIWLVGRGRVPLLWGLLLATVLEGGWELFENSQYIINKYQGTGINENYNGDSVINAVGDLVIMSLGFVIASRIPAWASVALFILIEVGMAWLIRDNLILNVISLTHPIEVISKWQEGQN
jgi:hypothetical protein